LPSTCTCAGTTRRTPPARTPTCCAGRPET
jgi:hypothetical protein